MSKSTDCCEVGKPTKLNPYDGLNITGNKKQFKYFEIENPLQNVIQDPAELQKFFKLFPFIPFAGFDKVTAHSLLKKFIDYKVLSVTTGAIIESINTYSFGAPIQLVRNYLTEFDLGEEVQGIDSGLKRQFAEFLTTVNKGGRTWNECAECATESFELTGNSFLEIIHTETAGVKDSKIVIHPATDCLYLATCEGEQKQIGVSKQWSDDYLRKNPPRLVPLFDGTEESYKTFKDGTKRTMLHQKNGFNYWYGRPIAQGAIIDQYNEHQVRTYTAKQVSKAFIGNIIIEVEEDQKNPIIDNGRDKKAGFENTADRFQKNFSNAGQDPQSLMLLSRGFGAKAASVTQIRPITDATYLKEVSEQTRCNICMAFDWSEALLRKEKSSGFNSDMYKNLFEIQSATKVLRVQTKRAELFNTAIEEIVKFHERLEFQNIGLRFKSPIQKLLEQKATAENESNNSISTEGGVDLQNVLNAYGTAVRSGAITPQLKDEDYFREKIGLPDVCEEVKGAWKEDEGFKRPVTLKSRAIQKKEEEQIQSNDNNSNTDIQ